MEEPSPGMNVKLVNESLSTSYDFEASSRTVCPARTIIGLALIAATGLDALTLTTIAVVASVMFSLSSLN